MKGKFFNVLTSTLLFASLVSGSALAMDSDFIINHGVDADGINYTEKTYLNSENHIFELMKETMKETPFKTSGSYYEKGEIEKKGYKEYLDIGSFLPRSYRPYIRPRVEGAVYCWVGKGNDYVHSVNITKWRMDRVGFSVKEDGDSKEIRKVEKNRDNKKYYELRGWKQPLEICGDGSMNMKKTVDNETYAELRGDGNFKVRGKKISGGGTGGHSSGSSYECSFGVSENFVQYVDLIVMPKTVLPRISLKIK